MPELSSETTGPEVRLRDVINMIIGVIIAVAPWFNGDDAFSHGAIRLRFVAACICGLSLWIIGHQRDVKAELMNAILGIALITAPLWRGGIDPYRVDMAAAGAIVAAFSASCAIRIIRDRLVEDSRAHADRVKHRFSLN
jgi:hypothetical protein